MVRVLLPPPRLRVRGLTGAVLRARRLVARVTEFGEGGAHRLLFEVSGACAWVELRHAPHMLLVVGAVARAPASGPWFPIAARPAPPLPPPSIPAARVDGGTAPPPPPPPADPASATECIVCYDGPRHFIFIPCGHKCVCGVCADRIRQGQARVCPLCRLQFSGVFRVFE